MAVGVGAWVGLAVAVGVGLGSGVDVAVGVASALTASGSQTLDLAGAALVAVRQNSTVITAQGMAVAASHLHNVSGTMPPMITGSYQGSTGLARR